LVILEFELRSLSLLGECSVTWAIPPALFFALVIA
jgi:hypothetical protein